jgi:hypothetical protein
MVGPRLSAGERAMAEAGIVALIGAGVAVFDLIPFVDMALGARLAFWIGGFLAAWLAYGLLARVGAASARLLGLSEPWGHALAVPFVAIAVAWGVLGLTGGPAAMFGAAFAGLWLQALMIAAGFFGLFFVLYARAEHAPVPQAVAAPPAAPAPVPPVPGVAVSALHQRLEPGFPPILALSAEDHYVRVIAEGKSALLLMPLAEATALMPDSAGAQVHRSWWVARSAVTGPRRAGRDVQLVLHGGLTAPVSRSRIGDLKAKGWISP